MKAEHRKELETNALAERVGRVVQGMKKAPQKRTMLWLLLAGVVVIVLFLFYRRSQLQRDENSLNWVRFDDGSGATLQALLQQDPESAQAKAAQFEFFYLQLRDALHFLAAKPKEALAQLDKLEKSYGELAKLCKDDKVLLPEALYARAVIEETRIIKDDDQWKTALSLYKEVADNHKNTAFGKLARRRVEILDNQEKREDLLRTYQDLRQAFIRDDSLPAFQPLFPSPTEPKLPVPGADK